MRSFDPGDSSSGTVKRGGKLPVLRIGDIGLCVSSSLVPLGLKAICGLLFLAVVFLAEPIWTELDRDAVCLRETGPTLMPAIR